MKTVIVVGGYGAVGAPLCRQLAGYGVPLVIAGRSPARAQVLAAELGAGARHLDVGAPDTWPVALEGIDTVVTCIDQPDPGFAAFSLERGIHYVDLTASDRLHRQIEALAPVRASALLSVGLAPGLTNLLAAHVAAGLDLVSSIEIGLLFGLGDSHGHAGLDWMAQRIFDPARPRGGAALDFGPPWDHRRAHIVDFSDQHALTRTFPRTAVTTRVAFDSRFATWALFGAAGVFPGSSLVSKLARRSFDALRFGSADVSLVVHARGWRGGCRSRATARFVGEGESLTTARLAALMIRLFLCSPRPGVWHTHALLDVDAVLDAVERQHIGRIERATIDPVSPHYML